MTYLELVEAALLAEERFYRAQGLGGPKPGASPPQGVAAGVSLGRGGPPDGGDAPGEGPKGLAQEHS